MIILFAPAKTFDFSGEKGENVDFQFKTKTQKLIKDISKMSHEKLVKVFKVPESKVTDVLTYYKDFDHQGAYKAMSFFKGEAFKTLNFNQMDTKQQDYLNQKTFIIDALYGVIKPFDNIKPYRLDFTMGLNLRRYWKEEINHFFIKHHKETILSLASKEFSSLIDPRQFDIYEVSFVDCNDGVCKAISVFNKQMRGYLLNYVTKMVIDDINNLPKQFKGYELIKKDHQLIYQRTINNQL